MNPSDSIKKSAIDKAKKVAGAATSNGQNGQKKRKKELKYGHDRLLFDALGGHPALTILRWQTHHHHREPTRWEPI